MEKSIDDIEFRKLVLKMYDEEYTREEISRKLNVKVSLLDNIRMTFDNNRLDVNTKLNNDKFTEEEDNFILKNINKKDVGFFIKKLKRSYYKIWTRKDYLKKIIKDNKYNSRENKKVNNGKPITKEEIEFIKEAINNGDEINDIAIALGRSEQAIKSICLRNKIKLNGAANKYTKEEDEFIRKAIKDGLTYKEIGIRIGRSRSAINQYCSKNKIKKDPDIVPEGYKRCSKCRKIKLISDFYKSKYTKDGLYSSCKECKNKKNRERKKNGK